MGTAGLRGGIQGAALLRFQIPMSVPSIAALKLPIIKALSDGEEAHVDDVRRRVAVSLALTTEELEEMNPRKTVFHDRVQWALYRMRLEGVLERVGHGRYKLSPGGMEFLSRNQARVDLSVIRPSSR